ncbi:uncharacterized protein [Nicotiana sylvestris]|uniref:ZCF37 n=2 Tax=Nicotiana TaxID=4085 RepID=A0A1S4AHM9_TOBAC|nr:PREDICTED: uncharacterized protein LOC104242651 [Nicotiana sylvestris]XP_016475933.1 PREDICTED: uncharacterized protein LOC107797541 [Nicotiana tabacum]
MVNPFICGSFHHQDEDDMENLSPCSTPKRSKKNLSRTRSSNKNNPYSDRGLDKFSALLADLEDKKQRIYSQIGPDDISFVRFVFSNSNDVKPIVVKLKDKKQTTNDHDSKQTTEKIQSQATDETNEGKELQVDSKRRLKRSISWKFKLENLKKPLFYLPMTIILILVFLAIYGRSFAIMCTSIGWYIIPTIRGGNSSSSTKTKRPKKKKEYVRRFSEKTVVSERSTSPTSVMNGPSDKLPPTGKHCRRTSWSY